MGRGSPGVTMVPKYHHQLLVASSSSSLYIWNQGSFSVPDILACLGAVFQIYRELEGEGVKNLDLLKYYSKWWCKILIYNGRKLKYGGFQK